MNLSLNYPYAPGRLLNRERIRPVLIGTALFLASGLLFAILIFSAPGFFSTDDYYHVQVAREMLNQGSLRLNFPWLPLTILNPEKFVDHHLLFHAYLVPWIRLAGITGAKLAMVTIAASIVVSLWALFSKVGIKDSLFWPLGIFMISSPFLFRLLMVRAQGPALLILMLALIALVTRRYRWLIPLSFAFTWLYNGFILIVAVAGLWTASGWFSERRIALAPVVYALAGVVLGLIINPYFPQNIEFILDHLLAKVDFQGGVAVGREWYPYDTDIFITTSTGAMLALLAGLIAPGVSGNRRDRVETFLMTVALLTLFMALRSRRFIEYFPAFALAFAAVAVGKRVTIASLLQRRRWPALKAAGPAGLGVLLLAVSTLGAVSEDAQQSRPEGYLAGAADWLKRNTPPGSMIFQTDWDDFPRLFFHNPTNTYLVGMDPTYLTIADPDMYRTWTRITQGRVQNPSEMIIKVFGARYVVSDTLHDAFEDQARRDDRMELVYRDQDSYIWQLTNGE